MAGVTVSTDQQGYKNSGHISVAHGAEERAGQLLEEKHRQKH